MEFWSGVLHSCLIRCMQQDGATQVTCRQSARVHAGREHIQGGASILQTSFAHTGAVRWQAQYQHMGPAAAVLLVSEAGDPPGCFAVYDRTGRSPRVYAAKQRDALLRAMQAAAGSSLGISLKGVRPRPAV